MSYLGLVNGPVAHLMRENEMTGYKWTPWPSSPKLYIDLKRGRKSLATIRRVGGKNGKFGKKWMVVTKWACPGGLPGTYGIVFPTMKAAKQFVEGRL